MMPSDVLTEVVERIVEQQQYCFLNGVYYVDCCSPKKSGISSCHTCQSKSTNA